MKAFKMKLFEFSIGVKELILKAECSLPGEML